MQSSKQSEIKSSPTYIIQIFLVPLEAQLAPLAIWSEKTEMVREL